MTTRPLILAFSVFAAMLCFSPLLISQPAVKTEKNIPYVPGGGNDQQLDLYLPRGKDFTTIVYAHEGSLVSGDKSDKYYAPVGEAFAREGIAFAAVNYRLGTANKWPAMAEDVAAAFDWVKKNIKRRGGNPANVFLVGHSSGSYIVSMLATDGKYLKKFGYALTDVPGAVLMGSMMHPAEDYQDLPKEKLAKIWERARARDEYESIFPTPEIFLDADPLRHVNKDIPPLLIIMADSEQVNPPILRHANLFADSMKSIGKTNVEISVTPHRRHMTAMSKMAEPGDPEFKRIVEFVRKHQR